MLLNAVIQKPVAATLKNAVLQAIVALQENNVHVETVFALLLAKIPIVIAVWSKLAVKRVIAALLVNNALVLIVIVLPNAANQKEKIVVVN